MEQVEDKKKLQELDYAMEQVKLVEMEDSIPSRSNVVVGIDAHLLLPSKVTLSNPRRVSFDTSTVMEVVNVSQESTALTRSVICIGSMSDDLPLGLDCMSRTPRGISRLWNLQTLIGYCRFDVPSELWQLSQLRNLKEVLTISDCEFKSEEETCDEEWEAADGDEFPSLHFLYLFKVVEEIPNGIGEIPRLQLIEFKECSRSVVASAKRIEEEQSDNGNYDLKLCIANTDPCPLYAGEDVDACSHLRHQGQPLPEKGERASGPHGCWGGVVLLFHILKDDVRPIKNAIVIELRCFAMGGTRVSGTWRSIYILPRSTLPHTRPPSCPH
ncbi:hypothetical protein SASPL_133043 [Salvia splendens]|uniref:Uncharacterized protein n=1 Tax=Salvia splendens TaxID=180675 RepID=A0A8X8X3C8_SALSN|nr:hypothetical protein SASPL_133043 [Salvia splendens]